MPEIRPATDADYETIVALNQAEVQHTSPMDIDRLAELHQLSSYLKVACVGNEVAGFLLAMGPNSSYQNDNYAWFSKHSPSFVYIDRIVVNKKFAGKKIGSALYQDLFAFAQQSEVEKVTCEYNIEPPNLPSKAFHDSFGFAEMGTQRVAGGSKLVSLQSASVSSVLFE